MTTAIPRMVTKVVISIVVWPTGIGPLLGDLHGYGFDMAFAAVFLVLLKGMWKGVHAALPWLFSLITAALFYLLISSHRKKRTPRRAPASAANPAGH